MVGKSKEKNLLPKAKKASLKERTGRINDQEERRKWSVTQNLATIILRYARLLLEFPPDSEF